MITEQHTTTHQQWTTKNPLTPLILTNTKDPEGPLYNRQPTSSQDPLEEASTPAPTWGFSRPDPITQHIVLQVFRGPAPLVRPLDHPRSGNCRANGPIRGAARETAGSSASLPSNDWGRGGGTTRVCPGTAPPHAPGCLAPASAGGTPPRTLCRGSPQAPASVSAVIPKVLHGGNPYWKIS